MLSDESQYKLMRLLETNPEMSQRALAQALGVSLGKVNYCLKALTDKGFVKLRNFSRSPNKRRYGYFLTPQGIAEKAHVTKRFLRRKIEEYEHLKATIAELRREQAR